jgi:phosphatidyl-myo-inositol dimannoside synthase
MRILVLCTDAYGGHGGIALYNRDLIEALALRPDVEEITVIPRVIRGEIGPIPPKVRFIAQAAHNQPTYLGAVMGARLRRHDLTICGHINLLPVAGRNPLLFIYGIEAWKPPRRRALVNRCRAVVSISAITRDRFLSWSRYQGPVFLLPNAIHAEQYGIRPKRRDLVERYGLEGRRVLLTVGRLDSAERYKGFDEVMSVLPNLPEDVVYLIAGGGNDFERLQKKAMALGIGKRVVFTGLFTEEDKPDLYALADVYVMPSRGEGFGFVFLEALASGIPVIGSKHDGGKSALLDGTLGLLVDPANPAELEAAIREQLGRKERLIPPRLDHFSFEHFTERVHGMVANLLSSRA